MKLKHVSVLRKYKLDKRKWCYYINGELDDFPSPLWCKYFQLFWMSTPSLQELSSEPQINQNTITIPVSDENNICTALNALREVVSSL